MNNAPAPGSPPSDYAIHALVNGEPGALSRVVGLTFVRSCLIAPGLYATGERGADLAKKALASSAGVSVLLTAWYWLRRRS